MELLCVLHVLAIFKNVLYAVLVALLFPLGISEHFVNNNHSYCAGKCINY